MNKLEIFKKKLLYRSNYRGTKELDILLSNFVPIPIPRAVSETKRSFRINIRFAETEEKLGYSCANARQRPLTLYAQKIIESKFLKRLLRNSFAVGKSLICSKKTL